MGVLEIIQIALAVGTVLTGLLALLRPRSVTGFTGLSAPGSRGITEIRAILGGLFVALGVAPLILGEPASFRTLGVAYLGIAAVRLPAMLIDRSVVRSNVISLIVEIVFGTVLVL